MTSCVITRNYYAGNKKLIKDPKGQIFQELEWLLNKVPSPTTELGSVVIYCGHGIVHILSDWEKNQTDHDAKDEFNDILFNYDKLSRESHSTASYTEFNVNILLAA